MLLPCDMFITYPVLKIRLTLYILLICVKSELARKNNCLKKLLLVHVYLTMVNKSMTRTLFILKKNGELCIFKITRHLTFKVWQTNSKYPFEALSYLWFLEVPVCYAPILHISFGLLLWTLLVHHISIVNSNGKKLHLYYSALITDTSLHTTLRVLSYNYTIDILPCCNDDVIDDVINTSTVSIPTTPTGKHSQFLCTLRLFFIWIIKFSFSKSTVS